MIVIFLFVFVFFLSVNAIVKVTNISTDDEVILEPNCEVDCEGCEYLNFGVDSFAISAYSADFTADRGIRQPFKLSNWNKMWCRSDQACSCDSSTVQSNSEYEYQESQRKLIKVSASSDAFFFKASFSGSAEMEYFHQAKTNKEHIFIQTEALCRKWVAGNEPSVSFEFRGGFIEHIKNYPTSISNYMQAYSFHQNYGTGFAREITTGSSFTWLDEFDHTGYDAMTRVGYDIKLGAELEFAKYMKGDAAYESEYEVQVREAYETNKSTQRFSFKGSEPPPPTSNGCDLSGWVAKTNSQPYMMTIAPYTDIMTPAYFPDDPDISAKREVMLYVYEHYCDLGLVISETCGIPSTKPPPWPPARPLSHNCKSPLYYYGSSCSSSCSNGYSAIAGGCMTQSHSTHPWQIHGALPNITTFSCFGHEDFGSEVYNQYVNAYVLCGGADMIKDIMIATCKSGSGNKFSNACEVTCPNDYMLTAGGCFVADGNWKISSATSRKENSYYCQASEDHGSEVYYQEVVGYATCLQFNTSPKNLTKVFCNSGTSGKYINSCTALCPSSSYYLIGGGCEATNADQDDHNGFKIWENRPTDDNSGWKCSGGEDSGTEFYNRDMRGYALCAMW